MFLAFQYPVEIPGVATMTFLKAALNAQRRSRGEADLTTPEFMRAVRGAAAKLKVDPEMLKRAGQRRLLRRREEARRNPADGAAAAEARACSTRPIPASTSTRCGSSPRASTRCATPNRAFLVITHYQRLLDYIKPDVVHVMAKGRIVKTGGPELALELERNGYRDYAEAAA